MCGSGAGDNMINDPRDLSVSMGTLGCRADLKLEQSDLEGGMGFKDELEYAHSIG
jgi:hypothetical protein